MVLGGFLTVFKVQALSGLVIGCCILLALGYVYLFPLLLNRGTWIWGLFLMYIPISYSFRAIRKIQVSTVQEDITRPALEAGLWICVMLVLGGFVYFVSE
jgi:hypothetical protein